MKSGQKTVLYFDVLDTFLKDKPIEASYDLKIFHEGKQISETRGVSSDSKTQSNSYEFLIPEDVSGIISVKFEKLSDSSVANLEIPLIVDTNHGNSGKTIEGCKRCFRYIRRLLVDKIYKGFMLESYIDEGSTKDVLQTTKSITDNCVSLKTTMLMLQDLCNDLNYDTDTETTILNSSFEK